MSINKQYPPSFFDRLVQEKKRGIIEGFGYRLLKASLRLDFDQSVDRLKWIDVDRDSRTIRLNSPVKGSLPRVVKVSSKTIAMIDNLASEREYRFNPKVHTIWQNF